MSEPEMMSEEEIDAVFRAVSVDIGWAVHKRQIQMLCRAALRAHELARENRELRAEETRLRELLKCCPCGRTQLFEHDFLKQAALAKGDAKPSCNSASADEASRSPASKRSTRADEPASR